jgi:hypothetical protein
MIKYAFQISEYDRSTERMSRYWLMTEHELAIERVVRRTTQDLAGLELFLMPDQLDSLRPLLGGWSDDR